jgi:hypothetical protein
MDEGTALRRAALFCSTSRTPFPEQINVTLCCPKPLGGLFEARDPASSDTEDFKNVCDSPRSCRAPFHSSAKLAERTRISFQLRRIAVSVSVRHLTRRLQPISRDRRGGITRAKCNPEYGNRYGEMSFL